MMCQCKPKVFFFARDNSLFSCFMPTLDFRVVAIFFLSLSATGQPFFLLLPCMHAAAIRRQRFNRRKCRELKKIFADARSEEIKKAEPIKPWSDEIKGERTTLCDAFASRERQRVVTFAFLLALFSFSRLLCHAWLNPRHSKSR